MRRILFTFTKRKTFSIAERNDSLHATRKPGCRHKSSSIEKLEKNRKRDYESRLDPTRQNFPSDNPKLPVNRMNQTDPHILNSWTEVGPDYL